MHDLTAVLAGTGADVDDPVGRADGVFVVLDHDQGVADVAESHQGLDQPVVVALVQADRRLVEDVQHTDQTGADLGRQPDPLRLATGQRSRRTVEREVVEPDVEQEPQPLADLLDDAFGDLLVPRAQVHRPLERRHVADRQRGDSSAIDLPAIVTASDIGLSRASAAGRARAPRACSPRTVPGSSRTRPRQCRRET